MRDIMTTLRVITAPAAEPVSLTTVKSHLRIDVSTEDTLLAQYIAAARESCEELARMALITQTLEMTLDCFPDKLFVMPLLRPPLQSVSSVKYYDSDNVQHTWTDYVVDTDSEPGKIIFNSLPGASLRTSGAVTVQFVAGYGDAATDVPSRITNAILELIGHWYEHRESMDIPREIREAFLRERVVWF